MKIKDFHSWKASAFHFIKTRPFNQLSKIKLFIKEYLEAQRASITALFNYKTL